MKFALLCLPALAICLASCTTLENRRDMYCGYGKVMGPYTKMLHDGIPAREEVVVVETTTDYKSIK